MKLVETFSSSGALRQHVEQLRHPLGQRRRARVLQHELVLRAADGGIDRQVLHRLQIERDARHVLRARSRDRAITSVMLSRALVLGHQIDQEAAAVQRVVGAVDADEGRQALDVRIVQDARAPAPAGARAIAANETVGPACGDALHEAGVLHREEALRDHDIEQDRHHQRDDRDEQRQRLVIEHPVQQPVIFRDQRGRNIPRPCARSRPALLLRRGGAAAWRTASAPASATPRPRSGW